MEISAFYYSFVVQVTKAAGDEEATCSDEDDAVSPGKWGIGDLYLDWHFYFLLLQALERLLRDL